MTSPIPSPTFSMPSPSQTFSFPSTSEPVFSVSTSEPAFESPNSQTSQNTQSQQQFQQYHTTTVSNNNAKFPYLKKDEYETWAMKMEYWIMNSDHNLWNIVLNGNSRKKTGRDPKGNIMILPPVSVEEHIAVQRETKARTILLQSLPEDHMADFHHLDDARDIWLAVKARFGGNDESKKMRKSMLKQEFSKFRVSESEGLHKGYDRFQKILSQLNQMQAKPDNEDCNMKFLRALPPSWSQVAITLKTKGGLDYLSFDDLYNKLRTLEIDVKGGSSYDSRGTSAPTHSAFISAASTNSKMSYADSQNQSPSITFTTASSSADTSSNVIESVLHSFVAESDPQQQITYEDFDQIGKLDLEELDIKWQMAMLSVRINRFEKKAGRKMKFNNRDAARFDKKKVKCYKCSELGHFARECTGKQLDSKAICGKWCCSSIWDDCWSEEEGCADSAAGNVLVMLYDDRSLMSADMPHSDKSLRTQKTKALHLWLSVKSSSSKTNEPLASAPTSVPASRRNRPTYVPAGSRNRPASVPAGSRNRPTSMRGRCGGTAVEPSAVLFTDKECLVLSKEFQLPENSQVILKVPRRNNLYCFNLSDIKPESDVTCLLAKASLVESTKWHRRIAYVNFKNMNKLAKDG
ncbi:ribonuclease H-like domain-containing protein [Tanacetum coccineum]